MHGTATLEIEVSVVSNKGFWLLLENEELFLAYSEFPWFKQATIEEITTLERPTSGHLYWPLLDIDLSVNCVRDPSAFPLISKSSPSFQQDSRKPKL